MGELVHPDRSGTYTLSDAEVSAILTGLYERQDETRRYIASTSRTIAAHDGHGENCCCYSLDHQRETLRAFEEQMQTIDSAIATLSRVEVKANG